MREVSFMVKSIGVGLIRILTATTMTFERLYSIVCSRQDLLRVNREKFRQEIKDLRDSSWKTFLSSD